MRLVARIGYKTVVFSPTANYSEVIDALSTARVCNSEGYGENEILIPGDGVELSLREDASMNIQGEAKADGTNSLVERVVELTKAKSDADLKIYQLEAKLKKFTDAAGGQ